MARRRRARIDSAALEEQITIRHEGDCSCKSRRHGRLLSSSGWIAKLHAQERKNKT